MLPSRERGALADMSKLLMLPLAKPLQVERMALQERVCSTTTLVLGTMLQSGVPKNTRVPEFPLTSTGIQQASMHGELWDTGMVRGGCTRDILRPIRYQSVWWFLRRTVYRFLVAGNL